MPPAARRGRPPPPARSGWRRVVGEGHRYLLYPLLVVAVSLGGLYWSTRSDAESQLCEQPTLGGPVSAWVEVTGKDAPAGGSLETLKVAADLPTKGLAIVFGDAGGTRSDETVLQPAPETVRLHPSKPAGVKTVEIQLEADVSGSLLPEEEGGKRVLASSDLVRTTLDVRGGSRVALCVEVRRSDDLPAGRYTGTVAISDGARSLAAVPLTVSSKDKRDEAFLVAWLGFVVGLALRGLTEGLSGRQQGAFLRYAATPRASVDVLSGALVVVGLGLVLYVKDAVWGAQDFDVVALGLGALFAQIGASGTGDIARRVIDAQKGVSGLSG